MMLRMQVRLEDLITLALTKMFGRGADWNLA